MDKYGKKWKPVFNRFEQEFPYLVEHIDDWYPSNDSEIIIILKDGTRYMYDYYNNQVSQFYSKRDIKEGIMNEEDWRIDFSSNLYHKMRKAGYVVDTLAEATGISPVTIRKYVNGQATPNTHNTYKIAKILKCHISELTEPR